VSAPEPPSAPKPKPPASTPDHPVATVDAPPLSAPVPPGLLARARNIAAQHRAIHGAPITAGQLAVAMHVNTADAKQILAVLNLDPASPVQPVVAVNGSAAAR
jgi:hypothetical protein